MKTVRLWIGLVLVAAGFLAGYGYGRWYGKGGGSTGKEGRKILYYIDPMHPGYKSDKPGIAPDCGMKLEPVYEGGQIGEAAPAAERKILYYRDPLSPTYRSDKPGLNPETGNELQPVYSDEPSAMPMGTFRVSPEKQQLIGVQYGVVESAAGVRSFRATGKVAVDETRVARIHARIEGWVDKVFVDYVGKRVEKGQPLLTIYSPELVASQQEYLLALKGREIMRRSTLEGAIADSRSLVAAARKRLELWELSDAQIDEVARTGKPLTYVTLEAPAGGYVLTRNAFPKQRIMPDTELYTIADLSRVWILADIYEYEAEAVRVGQSTRVSLPYAIGKSFSAQVSYIQPQVDPVTRTLKVRLEAPNPGLWLKPDMYVDVEFRIDLPRRITVPASAVLDSGLKKTVFVDRGNGYLEPRQVETGERFGDRVEVRRGLAPGERIVVSGTFLIDSESQLKAAVEGMAGHHHAGSEKGPAPPAAAPTGHEGHAR